MEPRLGVRLHLVGSHAERSLEWRRNDPVTLRSRPTDDELQQWCLKWLGAAPAASLLEAGHFSFVIGVRLTGGAEVVVKARPPARRLHACWRLQHQLWRAGFPCPEPLAGPAPIGPLLATAEAYMPGGDPLEPAADSPQLFAEALALVVRLTSSAGERESLRPLPAWLRWRHDQPGVWPQPDDREDHLNDRSGPPWLEEVARRARTRLLRSRLPEVIGHGDWESQNLRWRDRGLHVAHDWDSLVRMPEAAIAGASAACYPGEGTPEAASVDETAAFLDAYANARETPWHREEREIAWAAGLWVMAYNARIEALEGRSGPVTPRLRQEGDRRLGRAGA